MPRVSRYELKKDKAEEIKAFLWQAIARTENIEEAEVFWSHFLTPTEQIMLGKRLRALDIKWQGGSYGDISKELHASISLGSKVSNLLQTSSHDFKRILLKLVPAKP